MAKRAKVYWVIAILLGFAVAAAWVVSRADHIGWLHIVGVGLTLVLLIVIWRWPGVEQPDRPPN